MSEPLTEDALTEIAAFANSHRASMGSSTPLSRLACDNVPRLIEEIRRLRNVVVTLREALATRSTDREQYLDGQVLSLTVERDNLRKMLEDSNAREEIQVRALIELREQLANATGQDGFHPT